MNQALHSDLTRIARGIVGDDALAEDVAQEALLALHQATGPIRRPDAWLRRVTRNRALDLRRAFRPLEPLDDLPAAHALPEAAGTRAVAGWLPGFVDLLPEPYRTALRRVDLDEVSQAVFAEEAGLSPSGARTRVQRARRLLLASLQACCPIRFEEGEVVDTGVAGCTNCG